MQQGNHPNGLGFNSRYEQHELPFESTHGVASKKEATPGPGTYEAHDPESSQVIGHTSRFKDTKIPDGMTGQFAPCLVQDLTADPTTYEPNTFREIAFLAMRSFQQSRSEGKGSFMGTEPRELKLSNVHTHPPVKGFHSDIEDTPGPGAYNPQVDEYGRENELVTLNGAETMQNAVFASTTIRAGIELPSAKVVPGPGAYDPNFESVEPTAPDLVSKTGRDSNMVGQLKGREATGPSVGPGTYDPTITNDGARNSLAGRTEQKSMFGFNGWNASFVSDSIRSLFAGWFPDKPASINTVTV